MRTAVLRPGVTILSGPCDSLCAVALWAVALWAVALWAVAVCGSAGISLAWASAAPPIPNPAAAASPTPAVVILMKCMPWSSLSDGGASG